MTEDRARRRIEYALQAVSESLIAHGATLLSIAILMFVAGAPTVIENDLGPVSRILMGSSGALAGGLLLVGPAVGLESRLGWLSALFGAGIALVWHFVMVTAFIQATLSREFIILGISESPPADYTARPYIPLVYLGYVTLVSIHLRRLARLGLPAR